MYRTYTVEEKIEIVEGYIQANKQDESQTITIKYIIDKIFKRAE